MARCAKQTGVTTRIGRAGLFVGVIHASTTVALAQRPGRLPGEDGGWLQWVAAAVLALVICLAAFMNAKRSHLT